MGGDAAEWDVERALFPARVHAFLQATQPTLWGEMQALHAAGLENLLITAPVKEFDLKGTLYVLRHGFKFHGKTLRLAYLKPAHGLNDGEEVALQYDRLERVFSGAIGVKDGEPQYVKSRTEVGTGKATDEKAPLSEIIEVLNARFGTEFAEADRLFFQQIKEKACQSEQVIQTALANPLDKFALGIYRAQVEPMLARKNTDAYREAIGLIRKARALLVRLDREREFGDYLAALRLAHKPKRNFMKLLDHARW